MESEKVKEIKKALECISELCKDNRTYTCYSCVISQNFTEKSACKEALTLINELESELEKEQINNLNCDTELQYKEKRIVELEKENARLLNSVETVQSNRCTTKCELTKKELKQFAERLKEKAMDLALGNVEFNNCLFATDIDETLKEFIKN